MPVRDRAGVPRAIVAVFDTGEIDAARVTPTLEVFAERARAELARRDAEVALEESERGKAAALSFLSRRDAILSGVAGRLRASPAGRALGGCGRRRARRPRPCHRLEPRVRVRDDRRRVVSSSPRCAASGSRRASRRRSASRAGRATTSRPGMPSGSGRGCPPCSGRRTTARRREAAYEAEGTLAYVSVPIRARGRLWGYLGFDDCVKERPWSPLELEALARGRGDDRCSDGAGAVRCAPRRPRADPRGGHRRRRAPPARPVVARRDRRGARTSRAGRCGEPLLAVRDASRWTAPCIRGS